MDTPQLIVGEDRGPGAERRTELSVQMGLYQTTVAPNTNVSRSSKTSFVSTGDEKEEKGEVTLFRSLLLP